LSRFAFINGVIAPIGYGQKPHALVRSAARSRKQRSGE
jgi:hypothetical protein